MAYCQRGYHCVDSTEIHTVHIARDNTRADIIYATTRRQIHIAKNVIVEIPTPHFTLYLWGASAGPYSEKDLVCECITRSCHLC